jgi:hypothetical protein
VIFRGVVGDYSNGYSTAVGYEGSPPSTCRWFPNRGIQTSLRNRPNHRLGTHPRYHSISTPPFPLFPSYLSFPSFSSPLFFPYFHPVSIPSPLPPIPSKSNIPGHPLSIITNQTPILFPKESHKAIQFIRLSNQSSLPILFLHNVTGFMVGQKTERAGLVKSGSLFVDAVSRSRVPHLSVICGASYGAGNYAVLFPFLWQMSSYVFLCLQCFNHCFELFLSFSLEWFALESLD